MPAPVVVAEIVRSGFVEGHHYGSIVVLGRDGEADWSVGDVTSAMFPRSCNKPVQALAMLRAGLDLPPDLLALACASHSGEPFHLDGVRRILAGAGLDESALQTPLDYPLDDVAREEWIRSGRERERVAMNCSGKHAAMLATCVVNGWDVATYLDPDHPLQVWIAKTFAELTGQPVEAVAVDGCGAPLLSTSLTGLARAFRTLAIAEDGLERRVADAIRAHPQFTSGTRRDEAALLRAIPGAIGKAGAESCYAVALPDGRTVVGLQRDGAAGADGGRAGAHGRAGRAGGRRRCRTSYRRGGAARRGCPGRWDPIRRVTWIAPEHLSLASEQWLNMLSSSSRGRSEPLCQSSGKLTQGNNS